VLSVTIFIVIYFSFASKALPSAGILLDPYRFVKYIDKIFSKS